ncbi:hypothetical protein HALLA_18225 [Halostagnicola larsenii XH-48]|uniref:Uncharacterized protein n=1 Tax=Halostagnicola larsenii XH-48 TaxID=797299 RepID=W0JT84_9EURY|nr:hypothetical protein [Halostagnicola larsenii]AHG00445.1 hypothetical protein HALLA_18225 [Halostagnicola larsenii XH-48]
MSNDKVSTQDTMRERADESRLKLWLLVGANRLLVTAVLAATFFVLFMLGGVFDPPLTNLLQRRGVIESMFSSMISALITGVTLVVTISQLIVSQENGPLGEQRTRMSETMDYRDYIKEIVGKPAPADPSTFLREIVGATQTRAEDVRERIKSTENEDLEQEVDELVDSIIGNSETVQEKLDGATFGTFDVVYASMDYNYAWKIFQIERIEDEYEDVLEDEHRDAFDELRTSLVMFGPAREHIKTLYFQWELIDLSRLILYAAIPALLVSGMMLTFVDILTIGGTTLGAENLLWVVAIAYTFTLIPFLMLTAYVLRIATVAKRTLAIGALILRDSQR